MAWYSGVSFCGMSESSEQQEFAWRATGAPKRQIVSVSRRTDVPAFYGEWFMNRLEAGFAGWKNPYGGQRHLVSLCREAVLAFVFWSKNFRPFLPHLLAVREAGFPCLFHYTITGLPKELESNVVDAGDAIDSLRELGRLFSPEHIDWRYDPIIVSSRTDENYHADRFAWLAGQLEGHVKRCYVSFLTPYRKVLRNLGEFERKHEAGLLGLDAGRRHALATRLAAIAAARGIAMFSCCGDALTGGQIQKARCIDGELLSRLHPGLPAGRQIPTRPECGCSAAVDIGCYDTCPHGCVYCYANMNRPKAAHAHALHDPESAFLGVPRAESDRWIEEIRQLA